MRGEAWEAMGQRRWGLEGNGEGGKEEWGHEGGEAASRAAAAGSGSAGPARPPRAQGKGAQGRAWRGACVALPRTESHQRQRWQRRSGSREAAAAAQRGSGGSDGWPPPLPSSPPPPSPPTCKNEADRQARGRKRPRGAGVVRGLGEQGGCTGGVVGVKQDGGAEHIWVVCMGARVGEGKVGE